MPVSYTHLDVYKRQTLHELKWDGRFGHANKQWAERACIPTDLNHNSDFVVRSHPAVLDGFVTFCLLYTSHFTT